ncbi:MAG: hypothetical protein ACP5RP_02980 [Candidatus Micrarchaeia archaeon]
MSDEEYYRLLDNAFSKLSTLSKENVDFVIPKPNVIVQGGKTDIRNISEIADKARKKPAEIARFLSKEFGVPALIDKQSLVLNGRFSEEDIEKKITRYFEIYVICRECHKPDTHLENAGHGLLYIVCEACGAKYSVKTY